jgi:hypothetical protein
MALTFFKIPQCPHKYVRGTDLKCMYCREVVSAVLICTVGYNYCGRCGLHYLPDLRRRRHTDHACLKLVRQEKT